MKSKYTKHQIIFIQHSVLFLTIISIGLSLSIYGLFTDNYKLGLAIHISFFIGIITIMIGLLRVMILDFKNENN